MNGAERITKERDRQITEEGWTVKHDDNHMSGEMAIAAACYAGEAAEIELLHDTGGLDCNPWPWDDKWDKRVENPTLDDKIRMLEKAGALCAAEIDRLLRMKNGVGIT